MFSVISRVSMEETGAAEENWRPSANELTNLIITELARIGFELRGYVIPKHLLK